MKTPNNYLSFEAVHERLLLDKETGILTWKPKTGDSPQVKRYNRRCAGKEAGSENRRGYRTLEINGHSYFAHRLIFLMVHGHWPVPLCDHIDRDTTNNRPSNLREATHAENSRNGNPRRNNTSGHRNVSRDLRGGWQVGLTTNGKRKGIGRFKSFEAACLAADEAVRRYHGPFNHLG